MIRKREELRGKNETGGIQIQDHTKYTEKELQVIGSCLEMDVVWRGVSGVGEIAFLNWKQGGNPWSSPIP